MHLLCLVLSLSLGIYGDLDAWYRSYVTFDRVVKRTGGIPTQTGFLAQLKLVYFNLGPMNYNSQNATLIGAQYKAAVTNAAILAQLLGAWGGVGPDGTPTGSCPYCPFPTAYFPPGIYGRFPIITPPPLGDFVANAAGLPPTMSDVFFQGCQITKSCIVIAQYSGTEDWKKCRPQLLVTTDPANPFTYGIPPECTKAVDPTLVADKRPLARRFEYGFSVLAGQDQMLAALVSWFRAKNAQTCVMYFTTESTFRQHSAPAVLGSSHC